MLANKIKRIFCCKFKFYKLHFEFTKKKTMEFSKIWIWSAKTQLIYLLNSNSLVSYKTVKASVATRTTINNYKLYFGWRICFALFSKTPCISVGAQDGHDHVMKQGIILYLVEMQYLLLVTGETSPLTNN